MSVTDMLKVGCSQLDRSGGRGRGLVRRSRDSVNPPVQESARILIVLRILFVWVFSFSRPADRFPPASSVPTPSKLFYDPKRSLELVCILMYS